MQYISMHVYSRAITLHARHHIIIVVIIITIWNHYHSTVSSELLAKVAVLKDMLLFRDDPNLCTDLFDADEIAAAINCICTELLIA